MKKQVAILFSIVLLVFGFYLVYTRPLTKRYYYPFNDANNLIIKDVYENGKVSCGSMGYCLHIDTIISTATSYEIRGGSKIRLNNTNLNVSSVDGCKCFDIELPNRSIIYRNDKHWQLLMDEITSKLFLNNQTAVLRIRGDE